MTAAVERNTAGLRRRGTGGCGRMGLRRGAFRRSLILVLGALPLLLAACADSSSSGGSASGTSNAQPTVNTAPPETGSSSSGGSASGTSNARPTVNTAPPETFGAGEVVRRGVWTIVAAEVTPYQPDALYPGNPTSPPRDGNQYVSVNWSLTNTSDEVQDVPVAPRCFELVDGAGQLYIGGFINTMHTHPPEYFRALPGEEANRPLYYEVPATATGWQYRSEC